jgi:hypothetical protein
MGSLVDEVQRREMAGEALNGSGAGTSRGWCRRDASLLAAPTFVPVLANATVAKPVGGLSIEKFPVKTDDRVLQRLNRGVEPDTDLRADEVFERETGNVRVR